MKRYYRYLFLYMFSIGLLIGVLVLLVSSRWVSYEYTDGSIGSVDFELAHGLFVYEDESKIPFINNILNSPFDSNVQRLWNKRSGFSVSMIQPKYFWSYFEETTKVGVWRRNFPVWPLILIVLFALAGMCKGLYCLMQLNRSICGTCPQCSYPLLRLKGTVCPECGHNIVQPEDLKKQASNIAGRT